MKLLDKKLKKIVNDKTSGSSEILFELHNHLKNEKKLIALFPEIIELTKKQFKSFQSIQKYLNDMSLFLKKRKGLEFFFEKYDQIFRKSLIGLKTNAKQILNNYSSFITISNSNTVFEVLKELNQSKKKIKIFVLESRPKLEGRILAKKLSALSNIKIHLITEAMMADSVKKVDAALIGADSILATGDVINKMGSLQLALLCKEMNKPFYVVADKNKFSKSRTFSQNEMPPEEIWRHKSKNLIVQNFYFEKVDKNLITEIITD